MRRRVRNSGPGGTAGLRPKRRAQSTAAARAASPGARTHWPWPAGQAESLAGGRATGGGWAVGLAAEVLHALHQHAWGVPQPRGYELRRRHGAMPPTSAHEDHRQLLDAGSCLHGTEEVSGCGDSRHDGSATVLLPKLPPQGATALLPKLPQQGGLACLPQRMSGLLARRATSTTRMGRLRTDVGHDGAHPRRPRRRGREPLLNEPVEPAMVPKAVLVLAAAKWRTHEQAPAEVAARKHARTRRRKPLHACPQPCRERQQTGPTNRQVASAKDCKPSRAAAAQTPAHTAQTSSQPPR